MSLSLIVYFFGLGLSAEQSPRAIVEQYPWSIGGLVATFLGAVIILSFIGLWESQKTWSTSLKDPDKLDQLKLVYDYVKFHIQLYLATPAVLVLVADGLQVKQDRIFTFGLIGMILVYLAAGIHAGLFMGRHVNDPRQGDFLKRFEQDAFSSGRRFMHHSLYWLGLAIGGGCLALSAARTYL